VKVDSGIKKLKACQGKANQVRLDNFFKAAAPKTSSSSTTASKNKMENSKTGGVKKSAGRPKK
jgi:hypothetical protein